MTKIQSVQLNMQITEIYTVLLFRLLWFILYIKVFQPWSICLNNVLYQKSVKKYPTTVYNRAEQLCNYIMLNRYRMIKMHIQKRSS